MYMHHFESLQEMGAEPHLNTCFRHFVLFVREFDLIDRAELAPLRELIDKQYSRSDEERQRERLQSRTPDCGTYTL